jgi:hypothetical protein
MADQRIEKWTCRCDGPIKNSVFAMHLQRFAWNEVGAILDANGQLPDSYWWEFMRDTYATTQAVAVRRQADTDPRAASLAKLIEEIRDDPSRMTRAHWLDHWKAGVPIARAIGEASWNTNFAGAVGTHLDPAIPAADFDALQAAASRVKKYVDRHVAHSDGRPSSVAVTATLTEVHEAIDVIGGLFQRYFNLLTGNSTQVVPVIPHDWKVVFRQPWIATTRATPPG